MIPGNLLMGTLFFFQTVVGLLGNCSILFHYFFSVFTGHSLLSKDVIVKHLTLANILTIISSGIPKTMGELGFKYFLEDIGCKLVIYIYRVARGASLHTMCLLSCFQAITINPSSLSWVKLKYRDTKYLGPLCSLSWFMHLLLNIMSPMRTAGPRGSWNVTQRFSLGYCSWFFSRTISTLLYFLMLCFADGLCLGLMVWASVSIVSILYRHKRQVQYLHRAQHSPRVSSEARATRTILILMLIFVTFYSLFSILMLYATFFHNPKTWLINIFVFLETCFPMFCPFVLISNNSAFKLRKR